MTKRIREDAAMTRMRSLRRGRGGASGSIIGEHPVRESERALTLGGEYGLP